MRAAKSKSILILLGFFLLILTLPAQAQMDPSATVSRIVHLFKDNAAQWEPVLRNYALGLFWALAGIEFTWSAIRLALRNADFSEFLAELLNRVLYIGFFLTLLLHSSEWAGAIVQSFRTAADAAGAGHAIHPANILDIALQITTKLLHSVTIMNPQHAIVCSLCAVAILICFGLMAANMIEALIESYIVISAGVFMMGFGGSSWTSEYAKKMLIYAISVGVKLFILQLIMGLGEKLVSQLAEEFNGANLDDALVMVGVAVIMWIVSLNIPNKVQGLINGTSFGQGGMLAGAITAAAAAGASMAMNTATGGSKALAGAAAGTVSALSGASKLAAQQNKSDVPPTFAQKARNIGKAGMANLGQRFRGEVRHGNFGMQIGHQMRQTAEVMREKAASGASKPTPQGTENTIRPEA